MYEYYAVYNPEEGLERINKILEQSIEKIETENIPPDCDMTYSNGHICQISAIFVDLRDSKKLFAGKNKDTVARIIRSYTSEIITILDPDIARKIGIRGDCVYGIYSTPEKQDICDVYTRAICVNTMLKMLNKQFKKHGFPEIIAGIGLATATDFIIKAGKEGSNTEDIVWIGEAVTTASYLSSFGNENGYEPIVMSELFYKNIFETEEEFNFESKDSIKNCSCGDKSYYHVNRLIEKFDDWISNI